MLEQATEDPAADLARGVRLLREVAAGKRGPLLRIYAPAPTVAFGQRDVRAPGYKEAHDAVAGLGFAPLLRQAGGRAMAYHPGSLVLDHIVPEEQAMLKHQDRFAQFALMYTHALQRVGIDAGVGELPGEYCSGEFSVHGTATGDGRFDAGRNVKLVGTAQRVVQGAWLFSSAVILNDSAPIAAVTRKVYQAMNLPLNPSTVGAAEDLVGHQVTHQAFIDEVLAVWEHHGHVFSG